MAGPVMVVSPVAVTGPVLGLEAAMIFGPAPATGIIMLRQNMTPDDVRTLRD